jgi:hypothetical protein
MTKGLTAKSVQLANGLVRANECALVQADGYRNSPGIFRGVMPDGRLAVKSNSARSRRRLYFAESRSHERRQS